MTATCDPYRTVHRKLEHPWTQEPGYITEVWETLSHEASERLAEYVTEAGYWTVWLVANRGTPSLVVYRQEF